MGFTLVPQERVHLCFVARRSLRRALGIESSDAGPVASSSALDICLPAFVTHRIGGRLRGCMGFLEPSKTLVPLVEDLSVRAAFRDPRFARVTPAEEEQLSIEVSVLTPPTPAEHWEDIALGRDGVILEKSGRRAVFLPEVATEMGWDRVSLLDRLSVKAGLAPDAWRQDTTLQVFQSIKCHEHPSQT